MGARALKIHWFPSKTGRRRDRIKGYYVGYRMTSSSSGQNGGQGGPTYTYKTLEVSDPIGPYEIFLDGLDRLTEYAIHVKAFNGKGSGSPSKEIFLKTSDIGIVIYHN